MIIKVMNIHNGVEPTKETESVEEDKPITSVTWVYYDGLRKVRVDDNHHSSLKYFNSKKEVRLWMNKNSFDRYCLHDLDSWDFNKNKLTICTVVFTNIEGVEKAIAFSTKMFILNDSGKTIDAVNLLM